jgi:PAS domain S-box-containing protein
LARLESDILDLLKADRELSGDVRRHLVAMLFASPTSLAMGAAAGSAGGIAAAIMAEDQLTAVVGLAIPVVSVVRVVQAVMEHRRSLARLPKDGSQVQYEFGAWIFSALLGLLAFLVLTRTEEPGLQLLTACVALGYAAGICARNAGRPRVALGQLVFAALPLSPALILSDDPAHWVLAVVNLLFIFGMSDITRKTFFAFQSAVAESRAREAAIGEQLDHLPNMIWSADARGEVIYQSRRWKEFTGLDLADWQHAAMLVHAADRAALAAAWRTCVKSGEAFEAVYRLRHRSGEYRHVLARARPERDDAGAVVRWHGACVDIHEQLARDAA